MMRRVVLKVFPKRRTLPRPSIPGLIKEGDSEGLTEALNALSPFEIAELITKTADEDRLILFRALSPSLALQTFDFLSTHTQGRLLQSIPTKQAALLLKELSPDDRTSFLQDLPEKTIDELVQLLPYEERILTRALLGYPAGSIGRLMTPDYIAVKIDWTIEEVLDHIQAYGHDSETIDVIYVVDNAGKLLDDIKLKDFLFVPRQSKVESIGNRQFASLSVNDSNETAINAFKQHNRVALPVIDESGVLLGIVTIDDILRLANEEATEDMQKIGGMEALNEPYMEAPFLELMRKRAGWLVVLFLGEMLTATALGYFEDEISKAVVLALFLPLIISSGGNAGSQASTLVIRAMALGEVKLKDWWKIVKLEVLSGLFLGVVLGAIGFFRVTLWSLFTNIYGEYWFRIALTIGFSLIGVVLWGTLAGAILPLILRRVGVDPATSSAPFVATIVDVTGLIIYFLIAMFVLRGTLL
jgi:magnesium transporter